jgi:hypothetical protein
MPDKTIGPIKLLDAVVCKLLAELATFAVAGVSEKPE